MLSKSLIDLGETDWMHPEPPDESYLVQTCYALAKVKISEYEVEDLRIMIGQAIGLKYLVPVAIEVLEKDLLAEGDFYPGDLLKQIITLDSNYWGQFPEQHLKVKDLIIAGKERLEQAVKDDEIPQSLINEIHNFNIQS